MAAWRWSNFEEIPHVQGQRSPSKVVGTGVAAACCWSDFEEIPHIQGQRRSPSKMVGGVNSHLESNPILAKMLRGLNKLYAHQDPEMPQRLRQNCV